MTVGMAVNIPTNEDERRNLRKLVLLLDEAAVLAPGMGLYIQGAPGSEFLGAITDGVMRTWRRANGNLPTQT